MKNIAIILAGGVGQRVGGNKPKQLLCLPDGRTVLVTCIDAFRQCNKIDDIIVVMHPDYMDSVPEGVRAIAGSAERWQSSWNAIQFLAHQSSIINHQSPITNVLIHDCARPFVSQRILNDVCDALLQHEAVTVAVPSTDTMYSVRDGVVESVPPRATMFRAQTPQAFRLELIRDAYELALQDEHLQATDDCGIVLRYHPSTPVYIVAGEEQNRKITFKEDIYQ